MLSGSLFASHKDYSQQRDCLGLSPSSLFNQVYEPIASAKVQINNDNTKKNSFSLVHHARNHRSPYKKPSVTCIVTDGFLYGDQLGTKSPKGQKLHYKSIL